jgi:hypothetical protein
MQSNLVRDPCGLRHRTWLSSVQGTHVIRHLVTKLLHRAEARAAVQASPTRGVPVLAPTNIAAFNISGRTIHNGLHLRLRETADGVVSDCLLTQLQLELRGLVVVVINEIVVWSVLGFSNRSTRGLI